MNFQISVFKKEAKLASYVSNNFECGQHYRRNQILINYKFSDNQIYNLNKKKNHASNMHYETFQAIPEYFIKTSLLSKVKKIRY